MRALLPSGTSGNESSHHEVNGWFRNHQGKCVPTLQVQLQVNVVGKLQTHRVARYSPPLCQTAQATLLAATGAKWEYPAEAWAAWCREAPQGAKQLPLLAERKRMQQRVNEKAKPLRRISKKTPSSKVARRFTKKHEIKRHAFNVKRVKAER